MVMNNEECTLGSQVRNQSVENGSMPLGGATPLTSLYSLSKRSRDSIVSDSRSCGRAPSSISSIASCVSRISVNRLFLLLKPLPFFIVRRLLQVQQNQAKASTAWPAIRMAAWDWAKARYLVLLVSMLRNTPSS